MKSLPRDKFSHIEVHISRKKPKLTQESYSMQRNVHFVAFVIIEYFEAQKAFHLKIRYINM